MYIYYELLTMSRRVLNINRLRVQFDPPFFQWFFRKFTFQGEGEALVLGSSTLIFLIN